MFRSCQTIWRCFTICRKTNKKICLEAVKQDKEYLIFVEEQFKYLFVE